MGAGIGVRSSGYSISEGVQYSVALDYFIESDVRSADLYIEFWPDVPENGNRISWDGMINACVVKNAWTHFEKTVTAPQSAKYITLILYMNRNDGADGSDVAYLDNVVVRPSNPLPLTEGTYLKQLQTTPRRGAQAITAQALHIPTKRQKRVRNLLK